MLTLWIHFFVFRQLSLFSDFHLSPLNCHSNYYKYLCATNSGVERNSFLRYLRSTVTKVGDALPCLCYLLFTLLHRRVLNKLPHRFGSSWQPAKVDLPVNVWFPLTCLFSCSESTFFEVGKKPSPFCISNYLLLGVNEVVEALSIWQRCSFNNTPNRCAKQRA